MRPFASHSLAGSARLIRAIQAGLIVRLVRYAQNVFKFVDRIPLVCTILDTNFSRSTEVIFYWRTMPAATVAVQPELHSVDFKLPRPL